MDVGEGRDGRGVFGYTASHGRAFRFARNRQRLDSLDRFAAMLAEHTDQADLDAGMNLATGAQLEPGAALDPGGDVAACAQRMGLKPQSGNGMLHRIRQRLGPQAR